MGWVVVTERRHDDVDVLDVNYRMAVSDASGDLVQRVTDLLQKGSRKILLNLAQVPYIDSLGLSDLVRIYRSVSEHGGRLGLLSVEPRIQRLMTTTHVQKLFDSFADEAQALERLGQ